MQRLTRSATSATWIFQLVSAVILGQTLFFKFTGAPEAKYIFSTLGVEPWGRYGTGVVELVTAVLLLIPRTAGLGALLGIGLMAGAILSHLTKLGIEVQGDGGLLFALAWTVLISCGIVALLRRHEIPVLSALLQRPPS